MLQLAYYRQSTRYNVTDRRRWPWPWPYVACSMHDVYTVVQWRRSVVKYGVVISQVKPSNCFRLHPTSMIPKHSTILVPGEPRKTSFTFHFWHRSFILDDAKLAELSKNSFEWKNDIFLGVGVKTYSWLGTVIAVLFSVVVVLVRANVRNVLFVSNRTCVQNAFVIFPNVKRTCKHSIAVK